MSTSNTPGKHESRPPTAPGKGFHDGGRFFFACDYAPIAERGFRGAGEVNLWMEQEGTGSPLLLLHGGPDFDHRAFHPGMSALAANRRLVYLDLRGRCMSRTRQPVGLDRDVHDIASIITTLGLEAVDVLGHSHGGYVAAAFAHAFPGRVRRLVTVGTAWGEPHEEARARLLRTPAAGVPRTLDAQRRLRESLFFLQPPAGESKRHYDRSVEWMESPGAMEFARQYADAKEPLPGVTELSRTVCPMLFVAGEEDPHVSIEKLRAAAAKIGPRASVSTIAQCRHMPWAEQTVRFAAVVEEFLAR
ncbi:MAG: alpha/beta hydrolase [Planctomycetes bacterium]|nr:alpha/beta hydrolase [Planctomycetota bacterium]